jgi:tetratricopeptide (TPR) repeat protein
VPTVAEVFALALQHHQAGRLVQAEHLYRQILQADPLEAGAHFNLGVMRLHQQRYQEAAGHYRQVLQINPDHAEAHYNLGFVLQRQGKLTNATECYRQTLMLKPDHVDARNNLGIATMELGALDEAEDCFRRVLKVKPNHVDAQNNIGIVVMKQGRLREAEDCYRLALRLAPDLIDALNGLAVTLYKQGKFDGLQACYDQILRQDPRHADTHLNRAMNWLLHGDWGKGWPEYQWRWLTKGMAHPTFRQPRWDGSPLAGRTLLLVGEQGLGDTLQFVRFVPMLREVCGRVILQCQKPLKPLLSIVLERDVYAHGEALPPFDAYAPLLSLPGIMKVSEATIPAEAPYLHANHELVKRWSKKCAEYRGRGAESETSSTSHSALRTPHFLIGIAWQGTPTSGYDRQRSIPLAMFERLSKVEGVRLVSLQKGAGTEQLRIGNSTIFAPSIDEAPGPFMDSAAIIKNLDLVISADTAVAHLVGALGASVWLALPLVPDWRWMLGREDGPWYPSMRLFRQRRLDDWEEVFGRMAAELSNAGERRT